MPYATNAGVRIHYEVEGDGAPLVLHHGFAGCGEDWRDFGLASVLRRNNRLIILDARGSGASDKPHDPAACGIAARVADVTAVLDHLGLADAHFYGQSYGGWIGWCVALHAPARLRSVVISGAHPLGGSQQAMRDALADGARSFLPVVDRIYGEYMTPARRARLAANDFQALLALAQDRPSMADRLASMRVPCLLIGGGADPVTAGMRDCLPALPHAEYVELPGCGHVDIFGRVDLVLPHVTRFLAAQPG